MERTRATVAWVALLRAVNVGGHNAVRMAELRDLFDELGLGPAETYIQSGNVVFHAPQTGRNALAERIEEAVTASFDVGAAVILRTGAELLAVLAAHPFGRDTAGTHVSFLRRNPTAAAVRALRSADTGDDRAVVVGSDVYLSYAAGVRGARLTGAMLERLLGVPATTRNWRTVTRLAELAR